MYAYLMTDIPGLGEAEFNKYFEIVMVEVINGIKARFCIIIIFWIIRELQIGQKTI